MVWLRIDYNGHGFDAFVTDANLSRIRVSVNAAASFPTPTHWTHLAFAWDETRGVRLYVDGKLAAQGRHARCYDAGARPVRPALAHHRPHQVQSHYNFMRGGDIDELRIYDRMLADADVAALAKGDATQPSRRCRRAPRRCR